MGSNDILGIPETDGNTNGLPLHDIESSSELGSQPMHSHVLSCTGQTQSSWRYHKDAPDVASPVSIPGHTWSSGRFMTAAFERELLQCRRSRVGRNARVAPGWPRHCRETHVSQMGGMNSVVQAHSTLGESCLPRSATANSLKIFPRQFIHVLSLKGWVGALCRERWWVSGTFRLVNQGAENCSRVGI